jgi:CTP synthase
MAKANSSEFDPSTEFPVIDLMREQRDIEQMGGTMRLGAYPCSLQEGSLAASCYDSEQISERHRHRYEVNNEFRDRFVEAGLVFSGVSPDGLLVEMIELLDHPFFLGCQFHPELKSRPNRPHPLFQRFVAAALAHQEQGVVAEAH